MSIVSQEFVASEGEDDMARAPAKKIDTVKVDALVQQLKLAVRDRAAFDEVFDAIVGDSTLTAAEIGAIAQKFAGGVKPKNKKAALAVIGQVRLSRVHSDAKAKSAAKARVW
jgi:hypothetical protein